MLRIILLREKKLSNHTIIPKKKKKEKKKVRLIVNKRQRVKYKDQGFALILGLLLGQQTILTGSEFSYGIYDY